MNREQARLYIRENWEPIIKTLTNPAKTGKGQYICPKCKHGKGGDGLKINPHSKTPGGLKCFGSCGFSGDIIDLVMQTNGLQYNDALYYCAGVLGITIDDGPQDAQKRDYKAAADKLNANKEKPAETAPDAPTEAEQLQAADYRAYYKKCQELIDDPAAVSYLLARGIKLETAKARRLGYDPQADPASVPGETGDAYRPHPEPRIILPVTKSYYVARAIRPDIPPGYKAMNPKGATPVIWPKYIDKQRTMKAYLSDPESIVFVVEGFFNALSIIQEGGESIAIHSATNAGTFIKQVEEWETVTGTFILCLDNDAAGRKAADEIRAGLDRLGICHITADICGGENDPNDALRKDPAAFRAAIQDAQEAARRKKEEFEATADPADDKTEPEKDFLEKFLEEIQTEKYKPYKTELAFFDDLLGGGVIRQTLLLLLAAPAAGKTTLCQQLGEKMAEHGKPVIYLNLEMSQEQMIAKAISSRITRKGKKNSEGKTFTALDVLQGYKWTDDDRAAVNEAAKEYREKTATHLTYNPGGVNSDLDNITNFLKNVGERAKAAGEEAPVIILDYLHLITSNRGLELQELIKKSVLALKDYARDYDTFTVGIVATNRESSKAGRITLESGRDSSNIEYTADYQLSLQYYAIDKQLIKQSETDVLSALQREPWRNMIIRVLKSRFGIQGKYAKVYFNAAGGIFYGENDYMPADPARIPFKGLAKHINEIRQTISDEEDNPFINVSSNSQGDNNEGETVGESLRERARREAMKKKPV